MKKYLSIKFVIPFIILLIALISILILNPNLKKKFQEKGEIEFTKGTQIVQHTEASDRLRGRLKIPPEEMAQFIDSNELKKSLHGSKHDDLYSERCTSDRARKVTIRLNELRGYADIDILNIDKYPGLDCRRTQ